MTNQAQALSRIFRDHSIILFLVAASGIILIYNIYLLGALAYGDINAILSTSGPLGLAAMGQALVVLTRGIDLSAGATISLANVIVATHVEDTLTSQITWSLLAILAGMAVGAVNGFFVAFLRIQPIVATLATLFVVQGVSLLVSPTPGGVMPQDLVAIFTGEAIPSILPASAVIIIGFVLAWVLLKNTLFGVSLYAVGSDEHAAELSGISVHLTKFVAYVLAGGMYGVAGIFLAAQTGGGDPLVGQPLLLQIITAVVLGGTALSGGRGGLLGPLVASLLLMMLANLLFLLNVPAFFNPLIDGSLLLFAVLISSAFGMASWVRGFGRIAARLVAPGVKRVRERDGWLSIAPDEPVRSEPGIRWLTKNHGLIRSILPAYIALVVVIGLTSLISPNFGGNYVISLLVLSSVLIILAYGQSTVVIAGGLDLSTPWTLTFGAILFANMVQGNDMTAIWVAPLVLVSGVLCGLVNGIGVSLFRVPPLIMTLALNGILQGISLLYSGGTPLGFGPPSLHWLISGSLLGIPPLLWLMAVFIAFGLIVQVQLTIGRRIYLVGNSERVAFLSGINVERTLITSYCISGFCSALAGIILVGFNGQANLGMGDDYLLPSIAVVVAGGVAITGGSGNFIGVVGGALLLTALQILLSGTSLPYAVRGIVFGIVIVVALLALKDRKAAS